MGEEAETQEKERKYITITRAKGELFMTDTMFREIGDPDKEVKNPHYSSAAPMKLYEIDRLEEWIAENIEWIEKTKARREKLSKAQKKAHERKRKELIQMANSWEPELYEVPKDICDEARNYYTFRYEDYDGFLSFRGLVSYIRHTYTDYERKLLDIEYKHKGKTGVRHLYPLFRPKVDEMIHNYLKGNGRHHLKGIDEKVSFNKAS